MPPTRIEWARLDGDEAETVLSMLLYSKHDQAVRVRPASGDGGVDVVVPNPAEPSLVDVYQIKKFAENLTPGQKAQIDRSYRRLLAQIGLRELDVANWYLLMPLDPTPGNRTWFQGLPTRAVEHFEKVLAKPENFPKETMTPEALDRIKAWQADPRWVVEWKGLIACDALAAAYPRVPDYYLHGGRDEVESAVRQVASLLHTGNAIRERDKAGPAVQPADLHAHLLLVQAVLDKDPHFRYAFSLDLTPPSIASLSEPNLVAATQTIAPDNSCLTFKIYVRMAEALNERPVPVHCEFKFDGDESALEAFREWRKYGKPVELPASIDADLPGGLGGKHENGSIWIGPTADQKGHQLRHRLTSPTDETLAELVVDMEPTMTGIDGTGFWARGADPTRGFQIEVKADSETRAVHINLKFGELAGLGINDALPVAHFLSQLKAGSRLFVAQKHGPFSHIVDLPDDVQPPIGALERRVLRALGEIQEHRHEILRVPDFTQMTQGMAAKVIDAAAMLGGQNIIATWEDRPFAAAPGKPPDLDIELEVVVLNNFHITLGTQSHFLGVCAIRYLSAKFSRTSSGYVLHPDKNDQAVSTLYPEVPALDPGAPTIKSKRI